MNVYVVYRDNSDYGAEIVGIFDSYEKAKAAFVDDFKKQCDRYGLVDGDFKDSYNVKPEFKDEGGYAFFEFCDGSLSLFLDKMEVQ